MECGNEGGVCRCGVWVGMEASRWGAFDGCGEQLFVEDDVSLDKNLFTQFRAHYKVGG